MWDCFKHTDFLLLTLICYNIQLKYIVFWRKSTLNKQCFSGLVGSDIEIVSLGIRMLCLGLLMKVTPGVAEEDFTDAVADIQMTFAYLILSFVNVFIPFRNPNAQDDSVLRHEETHLVNSSCQPAKCFYKALGSKLWAWHALYHCFKDSALPPEQFNGCTARRSSQQ